jgi:hypothetical protein
MDRSYVATSPASGIQAEVHASEPLIFDKPGALTEQYMVYLHLPHAFSSFLSSPLFHGFIHRGFAQYALTPIIL